MSPSRATATLTQWGKVTRYETGARLPTFETALKLSITLGAPVETLFKGEDEIQSQAEILLSKIREEKPTDAVLEKWRVVEHLAHPIPKDHEEISLD